MSCSVCFSPVARQKKGTAIMAIPAVISSPATTFLMLILFTLLSCSALSVGWISTFILCYNCCRFHPVICFSFFLRSAQVCIHSLCVLKIKLAFTVSPSALFTSAVRRPCSAQSECEARKAENISFACPLSPFAICSFIFLII